MGRSRKNEPSHYKYLRNYISQVWGWDKERSKAKRRAQIDRMADLYKCEQCGAAPLKRKEVQIDHIVPRESLNGWDGWDNYIERTFCPAEGLQILCKPCHNKKSAGENAARRKGSGT